MNVKKGEHSMTVISLSPLEVMKLRDILHEAFEIYDDMDTYDMDITEEQYIRDIADFAEELEASL
jgi:hypothetical protein